MENLLERLDYLVKQKADGKPSIFAKNCGIPHATFHKYINGRMPHSEHLIRIHQTYGVDLNWLLTGSGEPFLTKNNDTQSPNVVHNGTNKISNDIELQQINLVREFIDKERALNINRELIELERLNPETFKRVESYIKGTVDMAREMARNSPPHIGDRRREQRRVHNKVNQVPNNRDRRSGTDRRKAGLKR